MNMQLYSSISLFVLWKEISVALNDRFAMFSAFAFIIIFTLLDKER